MQLNINRLKEIYPRYQENKSYYDERIVKVKKGFYEQFSYSENIRFFSAPGRIEIGGNHTDHQHGCVLAAAIDLDVLGVAAKSNSSLVRVFSEGYGLITVDISDLSIVESEKNTAQSLIRGIYAKINSMGYSLSGLDVFCTSDVLSGSGLSSSAAFEVFLGTVINGIFCNEEISAIDIAIIGQYAENVYFGKPSGLMDQMASSVGNIVSIDFKDPLKPIIEQINYSSDEISHAICIIDSGADHADLTDEYADVTNEMKAVANFFKKDVLRDVTIEQLISSSLEISKKLGDRAFLRAFHFFNDNQKAIDEAAALKNKDYQKFFKLVTASGHSSCMHLQNIYTSNDITHQKVNLVLALCEYFLQGKGAYRMQGGGFAGTIEVFVPFEMLNDFKNNIESILGKDTCYVLSIRNVGGVEIK